MGIFASQTGKLRNSKQASSAEDTNDQVDARKSPRKPHRSVFAMSTMKSADSE